MLYAGDYGVVGDGQQDDTAAVQSFLNLCSQRRETAYFAGLRVLISGPITASSTGIVFDGFNYGDANSAGFLVSGSNYTAITLVGFATDVNFSVFGPPTAGVTFNADGTIAQDNRPAVNGVSFGSADGAMAFAASVVRSVRVFQLGGFGIRHRSCFDTTFMSESVEFCGNDDVYAWSIEGREDQTCNECHWVRVQVELPGRRAMWVSPFTLSCTFGKVHSERAHPSAGVTTWQLGGSCVYQAVRLSAMNPALASAIIDGGGGLVVSGLRAEGGFIVGVNASATSMTLIEPAASLAPVGNQNGRITVIGGDINLFALGPNWLVRDSAIGICEVAGNLDYRLTTIRDSTIGQIRAALGTANQSATFANCRINGGSLLGGTTALVEGTIFVPTSNITIDGAPFYQFGYQRLLLSDSTVRGNIALDTAAMITDNSIIEGRVRIISNPQSLVDQSTYVTGLVENWSAPSGFAPYLGTLASGMFCKNLAPQQVGAAGSRYVLNGWEYVAGSWTELRSLTGQ